MNGNRANANIMELSNLGDLGGIPTRKFTFLASDASYSQLNIFFQFFHDKVYSQLNIFFNSFMTKY